MQLNRISIRVSGPVMYICVCNAINEKKVAIAARDDARSVADVFRRCGARPQCGKCFTHMAEVIEEELRDGSQPILAAE